ncbi:MAG: MarR family winged helix-turn-helix transcriptional regulator [Sciscionella sp.]
MTDEAVGAGAASGQPDDVRTAVAQRVERELSMLFGRARSVSLALASQVHPELDSASYALLLHLAASGPTRAAAVAGRANLDKSTVSRQIARLGELGLVERVTDPLDGRARLIQLTTAGHDRLEAVREQRRRELRARFMPWSTEDLAEFARLLGQLNETL